MYVCTKISPHCKRPCSDDLKEQFTLPQDVDRPCFITFC